MQTSESTSECVSFVSSGDINVVHPRVGVDVGVDAAERRPETTSLHAHGATGLTEKVKTDPPVDDASGGDQIIL